MTGMACRTERSPTCSTKRSASRIMDTAGPPTLHRRPGAGGEAEVMIRRRPGWGDGARVDSRPCNEPSFLLITEVDSPVDETANACPPAHPTLALPRLRPGTAAGRNGVHLCGQHETAGPPLVSLQRGVLCPVGRAR